MLGKAWLSMVVAIGVAPAAPAAAQQTEDAAAREEARAMFERGVRLIENENWEMARVEFARSYERYPTRWALFNLAMCHKALHQYRAALARFDEWEEQFAAAASDEERERVGAAREELRQYVGFLVVETEPAGATVAVDGEAVGTTPLAGPIMLDIGRYQLDVSLAGHFASSRNVVVAPLETVRVAVALEPEPPEAGLNQAWFWTAAAAAVGAGIGAGAAGGLALAKEDDLEGLRDRCATGDGAACDDGLVMLGDYDDARLAANVLFGVAGAFAATAVVLAIFTDFDFGGEELPVEVTAGQVAVDGSAGLGFAVAGRF